MTCREFVETAESLTPLQLRTMQTGDEAMSVHVRECAGCGRWLESQRLLGGALQVLRTHTEREAGPHVEQAVLRAFRAQGFEPLASAEPDRAAPAAWRLSRFFEFGAYAAVAAALIVGVFLGARMWRDSHSSSSHMQAQVTGIPLQADPHASNPGHANEGSGIASPDSARKSANPEMAKVAPVGFRRSQSAIRQVRPANIDRQGFVALMFCDPLMCSGDEQVIRMELPGSASSSAEGGSSQPVIADVVVGEDGMVRAMRIVN
jgi:hypothetical protein